MFDLQLKHRLNEKGLYSGVTIFYESVVIDDVTQKEALARAPCQQSSSWKSVAKPLQKGRSFSSK